MEREEFPFDILGLHTTPLGEERIRKNLKLTDNIDPVSFCRNFILEDWKSHGDLTLSGTRDLTLRAK